MTFYLARHLSCPSTLSKVHFDHLLFNICQFLLQGRTFCKNPPITDLMTSLQKHTLIIVSAPSLYSSSSSSHNNKPVSFYHLNQSWVHSHHLSHPRSHRLIHRCSNRSVIFIRTYIIVILPIERLGWTQPVQEENENKDCQAI